MGFMLSCGAVPHMTLNVDLDRDLVYFEVMYERHHWFLCTPAIHPNQIDLHREPNLVSCEPGLKVRIKFLVPWLPFYYLHIQLNAFFY